MEVCRLFSAPLLCTERLGMAIFRKRLGIFCARKKFTTPVKKFINYHYSGFSVFNKYDMEGLKKFQQKLPPVGFELTTASITGLEF